MHGKIVRALGGKVGFGSVMVPTWGLAIAVLLVAAAAGQAVGPVLSGNIQGSAGLTVEQSVVLDTVNATSTVSGAEDWLVAVNDEGTAFTAAIELHVGDTAVLILDIDNVSDAASNAVLELQVPTGIDIEVEESSGTAINEAQLTRNSWLMTIASGDSADTLDITISPKDNLMPGFYTLTGRIVEVVN